MSTDFTLGVDITGVDADCDRADARVKKTVEDSERALDLAEQKRKLSFQGIVSFARSAFNILDSTLEMFGVTMSQSLRMVVSGIFTAIPPLMAIAQAQVVTGVMAAQGLAAIIGLTSAIAGAIQLEQQSSESSRQYYYMSVMSRQIISMAGRF